jgi:hypothetical protein
MWDQQPVVVSCVAKRSRPHPRAAIESARLGVLPRFAHTSPFHASQGEHDRHAELAEWRRRVEAEVECGD